jgi:hypothetical protein
VTYQVGDTRRPFLDIDVYDGSTVVALAVVSQALGTTTPLAVAGPVVQPGGAGRWTATASYTMVAPGPWVERWTSTNIVTGLGAGSAVFEYEVEATPPPLGPGTLEAWATVVQYAQIIGNPLPLSLPYKLQVATLQLRPHVAFSIYDSTDAAVLLALAQACCLQVKWAADNGWDTGLPVSQRAVSIGSVSLGATNNSQAGGSGSINPISPLAWQVLDAAGLVTPHVVVDAYPWWV